MLFISLSNQLGRVSKKIVLNPYVIYRNQNPFIKNFHIFNRDINQFFDVTMLGYSTKNYFHYFVNILHYL